MSSCRQTNASSTGAVARDVHANFIQATRLEVDGTCETTGVRLFAGDMYQSSQNCSLVVSSTSSVDACGHPIALPQYACVPVRIYLFVLGPLACSVHRVGVRALGTLAALGGRIRGPGLGGVVARPRSRARSSGSK